MQLYQAALLETDAELLVHRIEVAFLALTQRLENLRSAQIPTGIEEQQAIRDALHNLRVLKNLGC
jgi:hypothetical protein